MNPDPVLTRFREISWRRELTAAEQAELRAWLAAHPETQADWAADAELNLLLNQLPAAPMPSNFTTRVWQAIERETAAPERLRPTLLAWWWQVFVPRVAMIVAVLGLGLLTYQHRETTRSAELAKSLSAVAEVQSLPSPQMLTDYEAIRRLRSLPTADEELLAVMQ